MAKNNLQGIADLVRVAVDQGAKTVEDIHRTIAELPLTILDSVEVLKAPVKEARRVQDRSLGAIYETIRRVNDEVAKLAQDAIAASQKAMKPKSASAAKPAPKKAAKKTAKSAAKKAAKKAN